MRQTSEAGPTPMMEAWRKDADEFGLPFHVQKGLMFLIAFGLRVSFRAGSIEELITFIRKLSNKISQSPPLIPKGQGVDYSPTTISSLLTEFAERFLGDSFEPRRYAPAGLYAGQTFEVEGEPYEVLDAGWVRQGEPLLPDCLCEETWQMADWDEVMTSLCAHIGEAIDMDLEGSYLAGLLFFERQHRADAEATMQIAQAVSGMLPPKFMWFRHLLNFDAEMAGQGNPMQKVFDCFLVGIPNEAPLFYRLDTFLSDQLHYESRGKKCQPVWDASLLQFACTVVSQRGWFTDDVVGYFSDYGATPDDGEPDRQGIPSLIEYLRKKKWAAPGPCRSMEEAVGAIAAQIEAQWGYRILEESDNLTPADNWTRRACIIHVCTANSVLSAEWNAFE